jgi:hypothetical protein
MKKSDASVVNIASRDISEYLKPKRKDERLFYEENIQTYTIDNLGYYSTMHRCMVYPYGKNSRFESYIVGMKDVNTKETRRLNRELGLDVINMKH